MNRVKKSPSASFTILSELMLPNKANASGNVHGGEVMKIMDSCAGVAATRHCKTRVVTVRVDETIFHNPVLVGDLLICEGKLIYTGTTSMEIQVTVKLERMRTNDPQVIALTSYFTFVSLDGEGKPSPVPDLLIETDQERKLYEEGKHRHATYKEKANKMLG